MNSLRNCLQKNVVFFYIQGKNSKMLTFFVVCVEWGGAGNSINLLESPVENKKDHMYDIPSA